MLLSVVLWVLGVTTENDDVAPVQMDQITDELTKKQEKKRMVQAKRSKPSNMTEKEGGKGFQVQSQN
jgi:hypothetical protein